jgi:hypothetical protein
MKLFADDTSLYFIVDDQNETAESLNSDLNNLSTWASDWCVNFNASKTKLMLFTRKHDVNIPPLYMNDDVLEDVLKHKHLGINLCPNGTWKDHINVYKKKSLLTS